MKKRVSVLETTLVGLIATVVLRDEAAPFGMGWQDLEEKHEVRCKRLHREFEQHEVLVVPIYAGGHFTCMSVWRCETGFRRVRYFETLNSPKECCLRVARAILSLLEGMSDATVVRCNTKRQSGVECGLLALHYVESEVRRARNENIHAVGLPQDPRLKQLRATIVSMYKAMSREHAMWLRRKEDQAMKLADMRSTFERRLDTILKHKTTTDEIGKRSIELALESLHEHANPHEDPPLLMKGIEVDPPRAKVEKRKVEGDESGAVEIQGGFNLDILRSFGVEPPAKAPRKTKTDEADMKAVATDEAADSQPPLPPPLSAPEQAAETEPPLQPPLKAPKKTDEPTPAESVEPSEAAGPLEPTPAEAISEASEAAEAMPVEAIPAEASPLCELAKTDEAAEAIPSAGSAEPSEAVGSVEPVPAAEARRVAMEALRADKKRFNMITDRLVTEGALTAEILRPAFRIAYEKVLNKPLQGVCSKCEWSCGCLACGWFRSAT